MDDIEALVLRELTALRVTLSVVKGLASIDVKQDEPGLLQFAKEYALPIHFYSAEELRAVEGEFTPSAFVAQTVGVENVCERSAVKDSGGGRLLLRKTSRNGVTLAIAVEDYHVKFDGPARPDGRCLVYRGGNYPYEQDLCCQHRPGWQGTDDVPRRCGPGIL